MIRPTCFLDVDGVLNAQTPSKDFNDWQQRVHVEDVGWGQRKEYPLWVSKDMAKALFSLPMQFVWLTDWQHLANRDFRHLIDAPELPVLTESHFSPGKWWKRWHVEEMDKPFVWLDDNIRMMGLGWSKKTRTVAFKRDVPHLALSMNSPHSHPNPGNMGINRGLRLSDIEEMRAFCEKLNKERE